MDSKLCRLEHSQREREKELDGLYRLAALFARTAGGIPEILEGTAAIIRESMQYSQTTAVEVSSGEVSRRVGPGGIGVGMRAGDEYVVDTYQAEHAYDADRRVSALVTYIRSAGSTGANMVIEEREKYLVDSAVHLLGNVLLRLETTEALRSTAKAKRKQARELERKNIALGEVLHQIERDRAVLVNNALAYIDSLVMPYIHELRLSPGLNETDRATTVRLEKALASLFETDPVRIMTAMRDLTPRETEIAGLIRSGMTTKEISDFLHIAAPTVERHRNTIRKKLGLQGRDINLTTYLRSPG